jgi:hypothetical protein
MAYIAKYSYNKNYQNVNSKRFQLTTVYFLTLNDHLACAIFDFDITSDCMDTRYIPQWHGIIISLF